MSVVTALLAVVTPLRSVITSHVSPRHVPPPGCGHGSACCGHVTAHPRSRHTLSKVTPHLLPNTVSPSTPSRSSPASRGRGRD
eukprot:2272528-Rhodomonas_salina.7